MFETSEYIDKQAFNDELAKLVPWAIETSADNAYMQGLNDAHCALLDFPAADVAPVKRGKWISMKRPNGSFEDVFKCSECEYVCHPDCHWALCPRCGAKMDA